MRSYWQGFRWLQTLARHDALFVIKGRTLPWGVRLLCTVLAIGWGRQTTPRRREGERLCAALVAMGASFIKLGQVLSVRPDFVGDAMADDLKLLLDSLPDFAVTPTLLASYFDKPIAETFADFDWAPVASASIAQVHRATTLDGTSVAVKLLRPGIREQFARDEKVLRFFATKLDQRGNRIVRKLHLLDVVDTWRKWTLEETNLRYEAAAADLLRMNLAGEERFHIPEVYWTLATGDALVLEWIDGVKITDTETLIAWGIDPRQLLQRAIEVFFLQVFRDGFFHADIHPGNLFVTRDGTLVPIDFGIMGRLPVALRYQLAELLVGFVERDYDRVARVYVRAGFVPPGTSEEELAQACRAIGEPLFGVDLDKASFARLLLEVISLTRQFQIELQVQMLLLQKTMIQAEGLGHLIAPGENIWRLVYPLAARWFRSTRRPDLVAKREVHAEVRKAMALGRKIDQLVDRIAPPPPPAVLGRRSSAAIWLLLGLLLGWLLTS